MSSTQKHQRPMWRRLLSAAWIIVCVASVASYIPQAAPVSLKVFSRMRPLQVLEDFGLLIIVVAGLYVAAWLPVWECWLIAALVAGFLYYSLFGVMTVFDGWGERRMNYGRNAFLYRVHLETSQHLPR